MSTGCALSAGAIIIALYLRRVYCGVAWKACGGGGSAVCGVAVAKRSGGSDDYPTVGGGRLTTWRRGDWRAICIRDHWRGRNGAERFYLVKSRTACSVVEAEAILRFLATVTEANYD